MLIYAKWVTHISSSSPLFGNTMFPVRPQFHAAPTPTSSQWTIDGEIFSHNACHVKLLGFLEHSDKSVLIRMLKCARTHTHTQIPLGGISQRDGGSPLIGLLQYILSFSKSGLEGQGAVGMSMIAAGKDCPDPQPPGKSGWSCAPSLCPSSVVLHSLVPQADVPIVVVKGFYLPKKND